MLCHGTLGMPPNYSLKRTAAYRRLCYHAPSRQRPLSSSVRAQMSSASYPCPACGFLVFGEPPGSYDICPVCGWEDDHVQLRFPGMSGGANKSSLFAHQLAAISKFPLPCNIASGFRRTPDWRPLLPTEASTPGAPSSGVAYFEAAAGDTPQYYWRSTSVAP